MTDEEAFFEQLARNADNIKNLLVYGNGKRKEEFINDTGLLGFASPSEYPLFKAMQIHTTLPKAYLIACLTQELYERKTYCVPFALATGKNFFNAFRVQKTRLLADATGESRRQIYYAARDKVYSQYIPNEFAEKPRILETIHLDYWSYSIVRTQQGEGLSWRGEVPEPPKPTASVVDHSEAFNTIITKRNTLGTKPYKRTPIITQEDLE